jgi:hypothetical protein
VAHRVGELHRIDEPVVLGLQLIQTFVHLPSVAPE